MKENEKVTYLTQEEEFGQRGKKRKISLLILTISTFIFSAIFGVQLILFYLLENEQKFEEYTKISFQMSLSALIIGLIFTVLFLILFLVVKDNDKKEIVVKKDEASLRDLNKDDNVEVVDRFADLTDLDDEDSFKEEEASNQKTEDATENIFDLDNKKIATKLLNCMHNYSITGSEKSILSALNASNLLFVKDNENYTQFLKALANTFGGESFLINCGNFNTPNDLYNDADFLTFIKEASDNVDRLYFFGFINISTDKFENVFSDFLPAFYDKNNSNKIAIEQNNNTKEFLITPNIFFLVFNSTLESMFYLSEETLKYSMFMNPHFRPGTFEAIQVENDIIPYPDFKHVLANTLREFYISNNKWKKIDDFIEFLNKKHPYYLQTDVINNFEAYTSTLLALEEKKDDVFDRSCAYLLFPHILKNCTKEEVKGEEGIYQYLSSNFFSDYNMNRTEALIKTFIREEANRNSGEKYEN